MAKKQTGKPGDEARIWRPERAMGVARALTKSGYATRSHAETLVGEGRVQVDGEVVTDPRAKVEGGAEIRLDGQRLRRLVPAYMVFNKPLRVVCRESDGAGRVLAAEYFPPEVVGLQTAGRLDGKTTGLLLVSNDCAWNNRVAGSSELEHEFRVQVEGNLGEIQTTVMEAGIHVSGFGQFRPQKVSILESHTDRTVLQVTVQGGQIRQLRRMFAAMRYRISMLRRVRIGPVAMGTLASGKLRTLTPAEFDAIERTIGR